MPNGNVFVFNLFVEEASSVNLNGMSAGRIGGAVNNSPQNLSVSRVLNASESPGHFFNGTNSIAINYPSGTFILTVRIDGNQFPLSQNLSLYIAQNKAFLLSQYGAVVSTVDVLPAMQNVSQ